MEQKKHYKLSDMGWKIHLQKKEKKRERKEQRWVSFRFFHSDTDTQVHGVMSSKFWIKNFTLKLSIQVNIN